jgi:hypothetical protein
MTMLSSDRMRTPHAEEEESETELWERLRSEAGRRSGVPDAPESQPAPRYSGYRAAPQGGAEETFEEFGEDVDSDDGETGEVDPYERYRQEAREAEQAHFEEQQAAAAQQASQFDETYDGEDEGEQQQYDANPSYGQAAQHQQFRQSAQYPEAHYESAPYAPDAQPFAQQQYGQPQYAQHQQYAQAGYQQSAQDAFGQVAAYGHVQQQAVSGFDQQQAWAGQTAHTASPSHALDHDTAPRRSRWKSVVVGGLIAVLGAGGAGYQFVVRPRQEAEKAAVLAQLQAQLHVFRARSEVRPHPLLARDSGVSWLAKLASSAPGLHGFPGESTGLCAASPTCSLQGWGRKIRADGSVVGSGLGGWPGP